MKINILRRSIKQQDAAAAAFKSLDPEYVQGLKELAQEPLAMLALGDYEGAALHIEWLKLENDDKAIFWFLFDSTQRRLMKAALEEEKS